MLTKLDPLFLISGEPLPSTAFDYYTSCLIRDLNSYVAQTYTNYDLVSKGVNSVDASDLENNLNGFIGGSTLGVHSQGILQSVASWAQFTCRSRILYGGPCIPTSIVSTQAGSQLTQR